MPEISAKSRGVPAADPAILRYNLDRINVKPIPEGLVRLNSEELILRLLHHGLVKTSRAHVPIGIGVTHEDYINAFADRGFLQGQDLTVH